MNKIREKKAVTGFIDKARIFVQGGKGGDGCLSFRREKFVPRGGPNGGNGGAGGHLYLIANRNLSTLLDFVRKPHYKAENGMYGQGWNRAGKNGADFFLHVPCGTVVIHQMKILGDLSEHQQTLLVVQGGRGGRGNASFKTSRNIAPKIAEKGEPGQSLTLDLELKLIADVGFIGCPNAGKSTLLSRISEAKPKIADYPFTTLSPNLGVVKFKDKTFVAADIPGLIEGAHEGRGLGSEFLRHIERTRILVHLIDPFGFDGKDAFQNYKAIQKELSCYSKKLSEKPTVIVVNKMDLTGAEKMLKKISGKIRKKNFAISAVTGKGLQELTKEMVRLVEKIKESPIERQEVMVRDGESETMKFVFENEFRVEREENGFRVKGKKIERLFLMTNFNQEEAVRRFQNILKKMGVEQVLRRHGAEPGATIHICDGEFTYQQEL